MRRDLWRNLQNLFPRYDFSFAATARVVTRAGPYVPSAAGEVLHGRLLIVGIAALFFFTFSWPSGEDLRFGRGLG